MSTVPLTPHHSPDSSPGGETATWEHIEDADTDTDGETDTDAETPVDRPGTIEMLAETFARLSIKADLDGELCPPSMEDARSMTKPSNNDSQNTFALPPPTIRVTPPSPPGAVEVKCPERVPSPEAGVRQQQPAA